MNGDRTYEQRTVSSEETTSVRGTARPVISWGALFAGLALVLSSAWLLLVLGSAIGVSLADATDGRAVSRGMMIGSAIWMILTLLVSFFVGALLTASLAGNREKRVGLLHGLTLWSVATVLMVILSSWGVVKLVQGGVSLATTAAGAVGKAGSAAGVAGMAAGKAAAQSGQNPAESGLANQIVEAIKQQAAQAVARSAQNASSTGGATQVSPEEARQAIERLDPQVLQQMALSLIRGDTQGAKSALAANANLSEAQVDQIIQGVQNATREQVEKFKQEAGKVVEAASSYSQAVLWATFVSMILGLAASMVGGWVGAREGQRPVAVSSRREVQR